MCGIAGRLNLDGQTPVDPQLLERMGTAIRHRGPDDTGTYLNGPVGLAHRRLSIIDLESGHQPLCNEDGTVWIVFNGEIYNYLPLREELLAKGHVFSTTSDTEVLVHLYEEHGTGLLDRICGMFAFALYDVPERRLFVARDRVGIKPLYYALDGERLLFASEAKALLRDASVSRGVESRAIDRFLSFRYLPGDSTLHTDVKKLRPGHFVLASGNQVRIERYWDLEFPAKPAEGSFEDSAERLDALLAEVTREHMIADVPVGCFASGGVDSTAILSYAAERSDDPLSTFTIGFSGESVPDERPFARLAAERFTTRHHEVSITAEEFRDILPAYVWHMEEPVCEPPAISLYVLARLAREHVKVVLSGEGGDEAFAGYNTYRNLVWLEQMKRALGPAAGIASSAVGAAARATGSRRVASYAQLLPMALREHYLSRTATPFSPFHRLRETLYDDGLAGHVDQEWSRAPVAELFDRVADQPSLHQMLYVDTNSWLPDDLLIKADKITMAHSLELRVPFLDHRVLEFAAALPRSHKLKGRQGKRVLKRCLEPRVPSEIVERKKAGFPLPYDRWLREDLREFAHDTLLSQRARERGLFKRDAVEGLLAECVSEKRYAKEVFCLLVLELWHRAFVDQDGSEPRG